MSETQTTPRTRRTAEAAPTAVTDELLMRIVEATEQRIAARPNPMALDTFEAIEAFAERAARTNMVPKDYIGKPDNIILAVMQGRELGLPPIQALQSIAMVNGRPSVWGDAVPGLCYSRGLVEDHQERFEGEEGTDGYTAICVVKRKGIASPKVATFSQADAKKAGLYNQNVHGKYPRRMMQWRARHGAFHDAFPDVLRGIGTREIEAEESVATPGGWTMPQPEKGWFTTKPQARSDGWDDTWFAGVVQKLASEPNAWKWLDLLVACLADAPTGRDVEEIGDLPMVVKVHESAPDDGKQAIDAAFSAARARFAKVKSDPVVTVAAGAAKATTVEISADHDPIPFAGGDAPSDAAPTQTTPPAGAVQSAAPAAVVQDAGGVPPSSASAPFEAWLVDNDGNELPDRDGVIEAYTDPVAYVRAFQDALGNEFPGTFEVFEKANAENLALAVSISPEAAALMAPKPTGGATDADNPTLPMSMPADPAVVFAPPAKPTKADMDAYRASLKAVYAASSTPDAFNHARDVNKPVYDKFPPSQRLACEALFEQRQKEMSVPDHGNSPDDLARSLMADIASFQEAAKIDQWRAYAPAMAELNILKAASQPLYDQVIKAADDRKKVLIKAHYAALAAADPRTGREIFQALKDQMMACASWPQIQALPSDPRYTTDVQVMHVKDPHLWPELQAFANERKAAFGA